MPTGQVSPAHASQAPHAPTDQIAAPPAPDMIWIPAGTCLLGSDSHYAEERPRHEATVSGFWMDRSPVTNERFARFVDATGHVTLAELAPDPAEYPGAKPEFLRPGSMVFQKPSSRVDLRDHRNWWAYVLGASWRHPAGPGSSIDGLERHPVVHVAYCDVEAFARWEGKAIPTEAEWERAARGGLWDATYAWGEDFAPGGQLMANTWQGYFPYENSCADGFEGTSPVGAFPPNGYDLLDMIGNVWEWTADWYHARRTPAVSAAATASSGCCAAHATRAGAEAASYDPALPDIHIPRKVLKGGSHLCAPNYCRRYRPAARHPQPVDTSSSHIGFRCIVRPA